MADLAVHGLRVVGSSGGRRSGLAGFEEGDDGEDAPVGVEGGGDSELAEDVLDVLFDRAVGYPQGLGDPGV